MNRFALVLVFCGVSAGGTFADEETFLDPAKAGPDYAIQGEYRGILDPDGDRIEFGLQVIALGDGEFRALGYVGGLPGDGWQRGDKVVKASGSTVDGVTKLETEAVMQSSMMARLSFIPKTMVWWGL